MELNEILSAAATLTALLSAAGWGIQRGTLANVRGHRDDLLSENGTLKEERTENRAEIAVLKADLKAISRMVTGETHWLALGEQFDHLGEQFKAHHGITEEHWREFLEWTRRVESRWLEDDERRRQ